MVETDARARLHRGSDVLVISSLIGAVNVAGTTSRCITEVAAIKTARMGFEVEDLTRPAGATEVAAIALAARQIRGADPSRRTGDTEGNSDHSRRGEG